MTPREEELIRNAFQAIGDFLIGWSDEQQRKAAELEEKTIDVLPEKTEDAE